MDTKKRLVISLICILSFVSITREELCSTYACGALPDPQCSNRKDDNSTLLSSYTLQSCKSSSQQCPFYKSNSTLNCEDKNPGMIKLYPGAPCTNETDCFSNSCNSTCVGTPNNQVCNNHKECYYGNACLNNDTTTKIKYCLPQRKNGENCKEDYDCINTHGCYNNTCIPYFSLSDGHPLDFPYPHLPSICQSGFDYNKTCARWTMANPNQECNDKNTCSYTNFDKTVVSLPENCLCGYNRNGKKFCKLGNGHDEFVKYVNKMKKMLEDVSKCNTEERGVCNHNRRYPTTDFLYNAQNLTNTKIMAENYHELVEADKCVINVVYPEYVPEPPQPSPPSPSPPEPSDLGFCASYVCKDNQEVCAHSHYETNSATGKINVVLSDICKKTELCDVKGDPNVVFYNKTDVNGTCATIKPNTEGTLRYPGEDCRKSEDCYVPDKKKYPDEALVGTCLYGFCRGYNETQACNETSWCWTGLYCSEGKCVKQKSENEKCSKTTECKNNYLCYQGKCQNVWYSLSIGTDVSAEDYPAEYYCIFGKATKKGVCDYLNNTDTVDAQSQLVKCNPEQKCNYTTISGDVQEACQCGYNEQGYAYCPKGNNHDTDSWKKLASSRATKTKNSCHSESRALCYKEDEDYVASVKNYEHVTERAHLFYGSPKCTIRVLDSSFLHVSLISIIISLVTFILF